MIGAAYASKKTLIHRLDPRIKLLWFASVSFVVVAWDDPLFMLALIAYVLGFARLAGIRPGAVLRSVAPAVPLLLIMFVVNLFLYRVPWTPTYIGYLIPRVGGYGPYVSVSLDVLVFSTGTLLRFVVVISSAMLLMMVTAPTEVALGLVKLGLPPEVGMAVSIAVGYVPVLFNQISGILQAQTSRGWRVSTNNPIKRLFAYIPVFIPTFFRSMNSSEHLAAAMTSRGFGYDITHRTYLHQLMIREHDKIAAGVFAGFAAIGLVLGFAGLARYTFTLHLVKLALGF
ncbi:MAG: energy-coupling factor transporter transmembrane protein EcfT [Firmicutes bacterium]|nr:energy-coupling factor transporter transmembrane protein EcfT [Bacillota bacterium]